MQKKCNVFILICLVLVSCSTFKKNELRLSSVVHPGEVKKISLGKLLGIVPDYLKCAEKEILINKNESSVYVLWSESYFSERESYTCQISTAREEIILTVSVRPKEYPKEKLRVDSKRVKLSEKNLKRVKKEREVLSKVYHSGSKVPLFTEKFRYPLRTKVTSRYGVKRIFNGVRKSQHLGIDFRAKTGRKIPVANSGNVALARNLFFTGNTVIVEHGSGIFTLYAHLSKVLVSEGDVIETGRIVGLAGKTGRVTGPHLHWGVKVHGNWVNGNSLVALKIP